MFILAVVKVEEPPAQIPVAEDSAVPMDVDAPGPVTTAPEAPVEAPVDEPVAGATQLDEPAKLAEPLVKVEGELVMVGGVPGTFVEVPEHIEKWSVEGGKVLDKEGNVVADVMGIDDD